MSHTEAGNEPGKFQCVTLKSWEWAWGRGIVPTYSIFCTAVATRSRYQLV